MTPSTPSHENTHTLLAAPTSDVSERLRHLLAHHAPHDSRLGSTFARLWEYSVATSHGGKLLRPHLTVGSYDVIVDNEPGAHAASRSTVLDVAAAIELLHHAFLLFDDVIDGDYTRRGAPNVQGILCAETSSDARGAHWAASASVLMGAEMMSLAQEIALGAPGLDPALRTRLARLWRQAVTESVAGEILDVGLTDGVIDPTVEHAHVMTELKTATYTFELPLRAAAYLADREDLDESLLAIARHLGVAYQLQDDLLSVFGDPDLHGKPEHADLRAGKTTPLIAFARTTAEWPRIDSLLHAALDQPTTELTGLTELLETCGARAFVECSIARHFDGARAHYRLLPPELAAFLEDAQARIEGRLQ